MPDFTREQLMAITARGGTLLVSAAAGSGKTTVLVSRVVDILLDRDDPCPADSLVIVTYTKAAAAELRERLDNELMRKIEADPHNTYIRRQKLLLQQAVIGTTHSFCSKILREYFAKAGIRPDFRIADDSELKLVRAEILDRLISERFDEGSEEFLALARMFSGERDDKEIAEFTQKISNFINSFPDPELRLSQMEQMYSDGLDFEQSICGKWLLDCVGQGFKFLIDRCRRDIALIETSDKLRDKYLPMLQSDLSFYEECIRLTHERKWDRLCEYAALYSYPALGKVVKDKDGSIPEYKQLVMQSRKQMIKLFSEKLMPLLTINSTMYAEDNRILSPIISTLCDLVRDYRSAVAAEKSERGVLEYDDLEHMTLRLLCTKTETGYVRTQTARELSERYRHIFIDEYQDTNLTQDMILRAVCRQPDDTVGDGENAFIVGDVKQSIYGFRKAEPSLFISRYNRYAKYDEKTKIFPGLIPLDRNFRSRCEITGFVNFVFSQLMVRENGGIVYSDGHELVCGLKQPADENYASELHLLSSGKTDDDDNTDIIEARYCARLVKKMLDEGFEVTDKHTQQKRPARPGDFCILRRAIRGRHGDAFVSQFALLGLPVSLSADSGFFETPEISMVMSLLRVVDNPLLDIPMTAVLRSPIFGFDCSKLLELCTKKSSSVYASLSAAAAGGDPLAAYVLGTLEQLRAQAALLPISRLLTRIYRSTALTSIVLAMPSGNERLGNLRLLVEMAAAYESTGDGGLYGFVRSADSRIERGDRVPCANGTESGEQIKIMTIHTSKGLEFPIVIFAGTGSKQNTKDQTSRFILHSAMGIGAKLRDDETRCLYNTLQRSAASLAIQSDAIAEELRVLYVALTRAAQKLIITAVGKSPESILDAASSMLGADGIDAYALRESPSFAKWITACVLRHREARRYRETLELPHELELDDTTPLRIVCVEKGDEMLRPLTAEATEIRHTAEASAELCDEISRRFSYVYPYRQVNTMTSKVTASAIHLRDGETPLPRPSFLIEGKLSPTERGTALHKFMQYARFDRARADAHAELEYLLQNNYLTETEAKAVNLEKVDRFFSSEIGTLLSSAGQIHREWQFTAHLPKDMYGLFFDSPVEDEDVILQGACDLLLITDDGAVIIDYKTDRVAKAETLAEKYSDQLRLYACAVRQVLGIPVVRKCIYSFDKDSIININ